MPRHAPLALTIALLALCAYANALAITGLRCEYRDNPLGVDTQSPRFSWQLDTGIQTAYQLRVASTQALLDEGKPDLWDSTRVESDQSVHVEYAGPPLASDTPYYWQVQVWSAADTASNTSTFTTGLYDSAAWKGAKWIQAPESKTMPLFRKSFTLDAIPDRATMYICGLGQYELRINGKKTGQDLMAPSWTNYRKTCLYNVYDVTQQLHSGENALGVLLGNGMYNVPGGRYVKFTGSFGQPKLICVLRLHYTDGSESVLVSDTTWKTADGPITFSCIYGGEDYDARREQDGWDAPGFDDAKWNAAIECDGPGGALRAQAAPPVREMQTFVPNAVTEPKPGIFLYDFGQNASGMPRITVKGKPGATIRMTPAEKLTKDGLADQGSVGGPSYFEYTTRSNTEETWQPRFTYTGFRYVQVEGAAPADRAVPGSVAVENIEHCFIRNSAQKTGEFSCDVQLDTSDKPDFFNRIDTLVTWAVMSNLQNVLTDCPHREKLGWLEETHLMLPPIMFNFDIVTLLEKVARDIREAQLDNGLVPDIAPEYTVFSGGFRDSAEWGSTCILMPWYAYIWYADKRLLEDQYDCMKRYLAYLESNSKNLIVNPGLGDWYDYIKGTPPGESHLTPQTLTATAYFYYDADTLAKIAKVLGRDDDAKGFSELATKIKTAFNTEFFNEKKGYYAKNSQCANAMALYLGMVPEGQKDKVLEHLVADVQEKWQTAGDIGHRYLIRALAENGQNSLIFDMTNRTDSPSYGGILAAGATSLSEAWDASPASSLNHFMLGHIQEWFQQEVGGIKPDPEHPGFKHFFIAPRLLAKVKDSSVSYKSIHGEIACRYIINTLRIEIPGNTEATLVFSDPREKYGSHADWDYEGTITLRGCFAPDFVEALKDAGIDGEPGKDANGSVTIKLCPGKYRIKLPAKEGPAVSATEIK